MRTERPEKAQDLAAVLKQAADRGCPLSIQGNGTKAPWSRRASTADLAVTTSGLNQVLRYDPKDLTISVQAGIAFAELSRLIAADGLMLPLDPPFYETATVGGVVACNSSGPRRRQYGTARDMVIGMQLATMAGQLVDCGGMVVKNVAGLDIAKLMIGSYGTLAALASVNFRLFPAPRGSRSFALEFASASEAARRRDEILGSVLQPCAIDLLNPAGAQRLGREGCLLLIRAEGVEAVLDRWSREMQPAEQLEGEPEAALWRSIREFVPEFLAQQPAGVVARVSFTVSETGAVLASTGHPALARAGNGVAFLCFPSAAEYLAWKQDNAGQPWKHVVEFASPEAAAGLDLWPDPGPDFTLMERLKDLFDPKRLLNPGRMYGRF